MRQFCVVRVILLALAAATFLAPDITNARSSVPFKASIAFTEFVQPDTTGSCLLVGSISGAGQATHLGKVTLVSRDCINPISQTAFSFSSDQLVLTAANGDQIFATYSGTFGIEGAIGAISGGYQIVGGTGRFSGATGAGTVQGVEDTSVTPAKGQIQLAGTISF